MGTCVAKPGGRRERTAAATQRRSTRSLDLRPVPEVMMAVVVENALRRRRGAHCLCELECVLCVVLVVLGSTLRECRKLATLGRYKARGAREARAAARHRVLQTASLTAETGYKQMLTMKSAGHT